MADLYTVCSLHRTHPRPTIRWLHQPKHKLEMDLLCHVNLVLRHARPLLSLRLRDLPSSHAPQEGTKTHQDDRKAVLCPNRQARPVNPKDSRHLLSPTIPASLLRANVCCPVHTHSIALGNSLSLLPGLPPLLRRNLRLRAPGSRTVLPRNLCRNALRCRLRSHLEETIQPSRRRANSKGLRRQA